MFIYALAQPIDFFDGLIPLPRWIAEDPDNNTAWALRAALALADARAEAGWTGSMRHLPSIGAFPTPGTAELFMVIKQDTGGTCFVITDTPMDWLLPHCNRHAHPRDRGIGHGSTPPNPASTTPAPQPEPAPCPATAKSRRSNWPPDCSKF